VKASDPVDTPEQLRWRIPVKVPIAKLAVAAILAALGLIGTEPWAVLVAAGPAAGLVAWAVRDLLVPVRLIADEAGVTVVTQFHRRHRLRWPAVERVRVEVRRRYRALEVDTGEELYLLGRYDLDADLDDVAERLEALRTAAG
jgi:hypothetical protein